MATKRISIEAPPGYAFEIETEPNGDTSVSRIHLVLQEDNGQSQGVLQKTASANVQEMDQTSRANTTMNTSILLIILSLLLPPRNDTYGIFLRVFVWAIALITIFIPTITMLNAWGILSGTSTEATTNHNGDKKNQGRNETKTSSNTTFAFLTTGHDKRTVS